MCQWRCTTHPDIQPQEPLLIVPLIQGTGVGQRREGDLYQACHALSFFPSHLFPVLLSKKVQI